MPDPRILIEACIDSVESALAAEAGGAGRVELCDNLIEGGTTPSAGTIAECRACIGIPIFMMIRPRGGDFLYSEVEREVMRRDIAHAKTLGADGVVLGLLERDGTVDVERTRPLVDAARPLAVTFHRAIDVARDPEEALDALVAMGVDRVLTSGQAATALEGAVVIGGLVRRARGRLLRSAVHARGFPGRRDPRRRPVGGFADRAAAPSPRSVPSRAARAGRGGALPRRAGAAQCLRRRGLGHAAPRLRPAGARGGLLPTGAAA